ncbi:MAG: hypothetical protein IT337_13500 [Thermomicrobiales bacterium]|nr:hypothetical protein [Thermomicrobiales bacterium]
MATDPIRRVRERAYETPLDLDARAALIRLAALPPQSTTPYLTASLDWRPEGADPGREPAVDLRPSERRANRETRGASRRPARQEFDRVVAQLIAEHGPRGEAFDSLQADAARIATYLDAELDPSAQGVFVVANSAAGVFEPLALGLPVATRIATGPVPALLSLGLLVDDHPTYAVLTADQHNAKLTFVTQATPDQSVSLDSNDWPRKQGTGGLAQRRLQARAGERVSAFARGIAEETQRALEETGVAMLVVAASEVMASALDAEFHPTVKERTIAAIRRDPGLSDRDLLEQTLPLAQQAERDSEAAAAALLRAALVPEGLGMAGPVGTLRALRNGDVKMLLMNDDFRGVGWTDFSLSLYGTGEPPTEHPTGGDLAQIVPIAVEDELVRLAALTGAEIQIVHTTVPIADDATEIPRAGGPLPRTEAAIILDEMGGVGALLRFARR